MVGSGLQAHLFMSQDHSLKQIDIVNKNCFLTIPDMIPDTRSDCIQGVSLKYNYFCLTFGGIFEENPRWTVTLY